MQFDNFYYSFCIKLKSLYKIAFKMVHRKKNIGLDTKNYFHAKNGAR
jgi:hypothetical protein